MGAEILSQEGFEVLGVTDGRQLFERLDGFAPDLILADATLPEVSGYEICRRVKADPARGHVKVMLLAGALEPVDAAAAQSAGADGVLQKPFEPAAVVSAIRPVMEAGNSRPAAVQEPLEQAVASVVDGIDREQVRAAVVLAVEAALPVFLDELTERVLDALRRSRS